MRTRHFRTITILVATAIAILLSAVLAAVAAAAMLDALIQRGGGSVNTMIPGYTYAAAAVMKVALLEAVLLIAGAVVAWFRDRTETATVPIVGAVSVLATPFGIVGGAVLVLVFQTQFIGEPDILARSSAASRVAVFGMMGLLLLGIGTGLFSLFRRERPRMVPIIGIVSNFALLLIFRYFEFYRLGFDQDRWAA
jgi:hypothetical protein